MQINKQKENDNVNEFEDLRMKIPLTDPPVISKEEYNLTRQRSKWINPLFESMSLRFKDQMLKLSNVFMYISEHLSNVEKKEYESAVTYDTSARSQYTKEVESYLKDLDNYFKIMRIIKDGLPTSMQTKIERQWEKF
jgi:hypothetical protein